MKQEPAVPGASPDLQEQVRLLAEQVQRLERRANRERLARKEAEQLLNHKSAELFEALSNTRESERHLHMVLWASGEGIWSWRHEDAQIHVDRLVMAGQAIPQGVRSTALMRRLVHLADVIGLSLAWQMVLAGDRDDIDTAYRIRWASGWRWIRVRGSAVERDANGRAARIVGTVKDITEQRASEQSLRLMANAFAHTHDAMAVLDAKWCIVEGNVSMAQLLALGAGQLAGLHLPELIELPLQEIRGKSLWRGERLLRVGNQSVDVDVVAATVDPVEGESQYIVVAMQDARERKRAQEDLRRQADSDALTGLPNRAVIQRRLDEVLRQGAPTGLIFIDLDGFKLVNDSAGHEAGDGLLCEVARRLSEALVAPAFVGRWGGDEFVVVAPNLHDEIQVKALGDAILERCRQTVPMHNRLVAVGASLGVALAPRDGVDAATLLRRADAAMYKAKENGRNCVAFFEPTMESSTRRRAELLTLLRLEREQERLGFVIQPLVDRQGSVIGGEMLMRWVTRQHGPVSPAEFIPLAEQAGLMPRLGRLALVRAVELAARLPKRAHAPVVVAVNLSAMQLRDGSLNEWLLALCASQGVSPQSLELELTESAYVHDMKSALPQLQALHDAGFGLSLDDFGTGYSAMSQLISLPFDKVKIDRSFVQDVVRDVRGMRLLEGIVQLCRSLGMTTVAEGVETAEQHKLLYTLGVDLFQGWHLGRPQSLEEWLSRFAPVQDGQADPA